MNNQPISSKSTDDWKILLVDDDEDDHLLARCHLNHAQDHKVSLEWAETYDQGIDYIQSNRYDAVMVDYDLGERTGIDFIREVAATGYKSPLILYTGRGSYETDMEAMEAGAFMYLTKQECTPLSLKRSIRYAIKQKIILETLKESAAHLRALVTATNSYAAYQMSSDWSEVTELKSTNFLASTEKPDPKWEEKFILEKDRPQVMAEIKKAIRNKSMFELEHRALLADGSVGWMFSKAVPIFDSRGEICKWLGVAYDITRCKQAEEKLKLYQERFGDIRLD